MGRRFCTVSSFGTDGTNVPTPISGEDGGSVLSTGRTTLGVSLRAPLRVGTSEERESSTTTGRFERIASSTADGAGLSPGGGLKLGAEESHWGSVPKSVSLLDVKLTI